MPETTSSEQPQFAEEVKITGILVDKDRVGGKTKKGYVNISGKVYKYADWVEPFLSRHSIDDVVDIIYKQHRNGGKTLVSIRKAQDPSNAVPITPKADPPAAPQEPVMTEAERVNAAIDKALKERSAAAPSPDEVAKKVQEEAKKIEEKNGSAIKTGAEIKKEIEQGAKPDSMMAGSATSITPPLVQVPTSTGPAWSTSTSMSPSPAQTVMRIQHGSRTFTFGGTINIEHFDNIKMEISGSAEDAEDIIAQFDQILARLGQNHPPTKEAIDTWRRRVLA